MFIRKATINDIPQVLKVVEDAVQLLKTNHVNQWQNGYPNYDVFANDVAKSTLHVVIDNDEVVGMCNLCFEKDHSYDVIYEGKWLTNNALYLVIHRMAVKKEYYHQGVAKMMFAFAENYAKAHGVSSIRVDTHKENIPMNTSLQKKGYVKCGIIYLIGYADADKVRVAYEKLI